MEKLCYKMFYVQQIAQLAINLTRKHDFPTSGLSRSLIGSK